MTVASEVRRAGPYIGNGVTTDFDYDFTIRAAAHLQVILAENGAETTLTLDSDYTVSGVDADGGGQVSLAVAPTSDQTITIIGSIPFTQDIDLENQGAYYAETVERGLDLAAMRDQQLSERLDRAMVIPPSASPSELANLVAGVLRLASSADNIDTVAGGIANVATVAGMTSDVATVAGVANDIPTVANIAAAIVIVAARDADISTLAALAAQIDTIAQPGYILTIVEARDRAEAAAASVDAENLLTKAGNLAGLEDKAVARSNLDLPISTAAALLENTGAGVVTVDNAWSAAEWKPLGNIAGAVTIDAKLGVRFYAVMTDDVTIDVANLKNGQPFSLMLLQDEVGSHTISWAAKFLWPNSLTPEITAIPNSVAVIAACEGTFSTDIVLANGWHL